MTSWTPINVAKAILLTAAGLAVIAVLTLATLQVGIEINAAYRKPSQKAEWRPKTAKPARDMTDEEWQEAANKVPASKWEEAFSRPTSQP